MRLQRFQALSLVLALVVASFVSWAIVPTFGGNLSQEDLVAAQRAIDSGRLEEAESLLQAVLKREEWNSLARKALVDVLMRLMRWEEAEQQISLLHLHSPGDGGVPYLGALVAFRKGDFERAGKLATDAIQMENTPVQSYRIRALSRFMIQDYEGYLADLHTLIEKDPGNPDPHYHLGRYYYEKQLFVDSVEAFEKATQLDPDHYKAHYFMGWCQQGKGDLEEAKQSYHRAIEVIRRLGVHYGWPYADLGELLITLGQPDEGLTWLGQGIQNDSKLPYAHYRYASALFKSGPSEEVEKHVQRAIELDPGYMEAFYLLGRYYQRTGDADKAKEAFAKFQELKKNPKYSPFGIRR